jgi:hypothetical protein
MERVRRAGNLLMYPILETFRYGKRGLSII